MPRDTQPFGLSCALTTPFEADGAVDLARLVAQAGWCLEQGCNSVTVFGTTGEGASIGLSARRAILAALAEAGFDFGRSVVAGVAASAMEDALEQARLAYDHGCRAILLAPPFYFKNPSEEGLFRWFGAFLDGLVVTGLSKSFGRHRVLEDVGLTVPPRSITAVLGPSGCGKTTMLRIVAGFETADAGQVRLAGTMPNGQRFRIAPKRMWAVSASRAVLFGRDLGAVAPLPRQARLGDFRAPQRGLAVVGQGRFDA